MSIPGILLLAFLTLCIVSVIITRKGQRQDESYMETELRNMEETTENINNGMGSYFNWVLIVLAIGGIYFTNAISLVLMIPVFFRMGGKPKDLILASTPKMVDVIDPGSALKRIISGLLSIVIFFILLGIIAIVLLFNVGCFGNGGKFVC